MTDQLSRVLAFVQEQTQAALSRSPDDKLALQTQEKKQLSEFSGELTRTVEGLAGSLRAAVGSEAAGYFTGEVLNAVVLAFQVARLAGEGDALAVDAAMQRAKVAGAAQSARDARWAERRELLAQSVERHATVADLRHPYPGAARLLPLVNADLAARQKEATTSERVVDVLKRLRDSAS